MKQQYRYLWCILFIAPLLVVSQAFAKVSIKHEQSKTIYEVVIDDLSFVKSEYPDYQRVMLKGIEGYEGVTPHEGYPEIPVFRTYFSGKVQVEKLDDMQAMQMSSNIQIFPKQPPQIKTGIKSTRLTIAKSAYTANRFWPERFYMVDEAGSINGKKQFLLTVFPFTYNAATGTYQLIREFRITLTDTSISKSNKPEVFVFVVPQKFVSHGDLLNYMELKRTLGFQVEMINVSSTTTPEQIRAQLQEIYRRPDTTLKYALIIGDAGDVPGKSSKIINGITDHYYRAIDTQNYDSDINGPDIGVGRISAATAEQLSNVLRKYTKYIRGEFGSQEWLKHIAFIATSDRWQVAEGTHNYVINTYTKNAGYSGVFPRNPQEGGDQLYAITHKVSDAKVVETMGLGRAIIDYSGHGGTNLWAGPRVIQDDVRSLVNPDHLPFVISNACITGNFRVDESFAETWQRHPAAAITFWGSMDSTYWDEDDILERRMFDGIFVNGNRTFSNITDYALAELWKYYQGGGRTKYYWETYVLFGDPSIRLRTWETEQINLEGPYVIPVGSSLVEYRVVNNNQQAVPNARVVLRDRRQNISAVAISDQAGEVAIDLSAISSETTDVDVRVYADNALLKEAVLKIIPSNSPYLVIQEPIVNGRKDRSLYVGELANLGLLLTNVGLPTNGGEIVIESIQGPATVVDDKAQFPSLSRDNFYQMPQGDLQIAVSPEAELGDLIRVNLHWVTTEGSSAIKALFFTVKKAQIELVRVFNVAGGIRLGERDNVTLRLKNSGTETITNGSFNGQPGVCISSVTGSFVVPTLAPGQEIEIAHGLNLEMASNCHNGDLASFNLVGTYESVAMRVNLTTPGNINVGVLAVKNSEVIDANIPIPDEDKVVLALPFNVNGVIADISVKVRIDHTYVGDLIVSLIHPDGTEAILSNRQGGSQDFIDNEFGFGGTALAALQTFVGKNPLGQWQFKVEDKAGGDTGAIRSVNLKIKGYLD